MSLRPYSTVIDANDVGLVARFWAAALGLEMVHSSPDEIVLVAPDGRAPGLIVGSVTEPKSGKNRIHLDLNPTDQAAEVSRLESLGATRVDVGQLDVPWVVLADPEGNEFCVLTARPDANPGTRANLEVRDVSATAALLADWFGFTTTVSMGDPPEFAIVGHGQVELGLIAVDEPAVGRFPATYLTCSFVEEWHARCVRAGAEITNALTTQVWGMRDFVVRLPDGHQLAVGQRVAVV